MSQTEELVHRLAAVCPTYSSDSESGTVNTESTLSELKIEDLTFFTLMMGIVVFLMLFTWLVLHRFRLGWLEKESLKQEALTAIEERRAEAATNEEETS